MLPQVTIHSILDATGGYFMRFRPLGPSGVLVSELSVGGGRMVEDDAESTRVIHHAIAAGCNYFETATFYCDGRCQQKMGLGLAGYTDQVMVSVKQGIDANTTAASYRKAIEAQFVTLGINSADWLQVGWLTLEMLPKLIEKDGVLAAIHQMMDEGIVRHIGFTGHDTPDNFSEILQAGIFESMTVSYHLLNRSYEPTIAAARERGVGVIVMNPVGGGILGTPSNTLHDLIPTGAVTSSAALALRFVLANPGVSTACSGMETIAKVDENVAAVTEEMNDEDQQHMLEVLDQFRTLGERFCTGCRYCSPCPQGVEIATCFHLYNLHTIYGLREAAQQQYASMKPEQRADACIRCGECEAKCPNKLQVMEQLLAVQRLFDK